MVKKQKLEYKIVEGRQGTVEEMMNKLSDKGWVLSSGLNMAKSELVTEEAYYSVLMSRLIPMVKKNYSEVQEI